MDQRIERRIAQVERETLLRLAAKAERGGVVIFYEPVEERHYATSRSEAFRLYRVSPDACDCRGWRVLGRCGHNALLRSQLGLIPDAPEPEPEPIAVNVVRLETIVPSPTARCPSCAGKGFYFTRVEGVSQPYSMTCSPCHGTGRITVDVVVGDLALRPVA